MMDFEIKDIKIEERKNGSTFIKLPELSEAEKSIIDPIVAPTSGFRIEIFDIKKEGDNEKYYLNNRRLFLFFRIFKAISQKYRELKNNQNLKILIVTDNRPSKDILLKYCSKIFAYDGFEIYYQTDDEGESKASSPYGAASVALYDDINLVFVLTASHNELSWNGIKFYIDYPMPMSGGFVKDISKKALNVKEIPLKLDFTPISIDVEKKNNEYVMNLLSKVIEIKNIRGKNIVIWPYLGRARGIYNLFKHYGANITLIEEDMNPPNPLKNIQEEKLQKVMLEKNSDIAILLDADRDRIVLYIKQNGEYFTYIPNEIYSAMHNILAKDYHKRIINVRTIPSDLRSDETSFLNIFCGVGYKHLGAIMYFLLGMEVEKSKIDTAILYMEDENKKLIKINTANPLKEKVISLMKNKNIEEEQFVVVLWEESGGHTINIVHVKKSPTGEYRFSMDLPLIADKYPVPALVLITELVCSGYTISKSIDWSIVGINRTIHAKDEQKVKVMRQFKDNDGKILHIGEKDYEISALSDNTNMIDIYQLKSHDSTLYFRPSGTGPEIRFYIFAKRDTFLEEIKKVEEYIKTRYLD